MKENPPRPVGCPYFYTPVTKLVCVFLYVFICECVCVYINVCAWVGCLCNSHKVRSTVAGVEEQLNGKKMAKKWNKRNGGKKPKKTKKHQPTCRGRSRKHASPDLLALLICLGACTCLRRCVQVACVSVDALPCNERQPPKVWVCLRVHAKETSIKNGPSDTCITGRSEERRVGKACRSRRTPYPSKKRDTST